jgi:hypothetical protein
MYYSLKARPSIIFKSLRADRLLGWNCPFWYFIGIRVKGESAVCQRAQFDCMGALGVYGGSKSNALGADGQRRNQKAVGVFSCYGFFILGLNTPSRHQYGVHEWKGNEEPRGTAWYGFTFPYCTEIDVSYPKTRKEHISRCFNTFQQSREFLNA